MTDSEWAGFCGLLEATFRGGLPEDREEALRIYFGKVAPEYAQKAVEGLVMAGQVFVPTSSELVAALRRVVAGDWHMRRILAGRSVAEQEEADAQRARAWASRALAEGDAA